MVLSPERRVLLKTNAPKHAAVRLAKLLKQAASEFPIKFESQSRRRDADLGHAAIDREHSSFHGEWRWDDLLPRIHETSRSPSMPGRLAANPRQQTMNCVIPFDPASISSSPEQLGVRRGEAEVGL